ncbi:hypothetical protein ACFQH6_20605 [Halobacteriaceae archaeon GCM10025711]
MLDEVVVAEFREFVPAGPPPDRREVVPEVDLGRDLFVALVEATRRDFARLVDECVEDVVVEGERSEIRLPNPITCILEGVRDIVVLDVGVVAFVCEFRRRSQRLDAIPCDTGDLVSDGSELVVTDDARGDLGWRGL